MDAKHMERYSLWSAAIAGAGVMSLEISGSRIVAPYFGTGVWVWSCLISVTLAGLALGYHRAGKKASREHAEFLIPRLFFRTALFLLLVISFFHRTLLFLFSFLGYLAGSLGASAILFFYPMYCLGQVLPYAVRWMKSGDDKASWRAGRIYSLSTLGSIFGTLLTGLGLAAYFGVGILIAFWVLAFLLVSARGRHLAHKRMRLSNFFILLLLTWHLWLYFSPSLFYFPWFVRSSGAYGEIMVFQGDPMVMSVDGLPQTGLPVGALGPNISEDYFYNQRYFLPALKRIRPEAKEALVIGLGGGLMEKVFNSIGVNCEFVEINPKVIQFAREYFQVTAPVHNSDGRWFLRNTKKKYDFIVLDVYQSDQLGWHMLTREALELAKTRLNKDGILTVHLLSFPKPSDINNSIMRTLRNIFHYVRTICSYPENPAQLQTLFLFASRMPMLLPDSLPGAEDFRMFQLNLDSNKGVLLTDAYFPFELAWAGIAQEWRQSFRADKLGIYNLGTIGMAIGGFIDAQVRSKVSRVKHNMMDISQHLASFNNHYGRLPDNQIGLRALEKYYKEQKMSNEISTAKTLVIDPFSEEREALFYYHFAIPKDLAMIGSRGPDQDIDFSYEFMKHALKTDHETFWYWPSEQEMNKGFIQLMYDPTNGTVSNGDIIYIIK